MSVPASRSTVQTQVYDQDAIDMLDGAERDIQHKPRTVIQNTVQHSEGDRMMV